MKKMVKKEISNESPKRHNGKYVYDYLREEILTLKLRPNTQLDETSLAERFNVSRSPVRDALARLVAEGLAITLPNRTTLIRPFNFQDFPKYIDALNLIQRAITRLAAAHCTKDDEKKLQELNLMYIQSAKDSKFELMLEYNKLFHLEIAAIGRNPFLTEYYSRLLEEGQRLYYLHFDQLIKSSSLLDLENDHINIIIAISQNDLDAAEKEAHIHTLLFRDRFIEHMKNNLLDQISIDN